jgi:hypothetical protein
VSKVSVEMIIGLTLAGVLILIVIFAAVIFNLRRSQGKETTIKLQLKSIQWESYYLDLGSLSDYIEKRKAVSDICRWPKEESFLSQDLRGDSTILLYKEGISNGSALSVWNPLD